MTGVLVAVGVVDILPYCISSKYFFWDPDLAQLSLGRISAIKEIEWVLQAQQQCTSLKYYYMGFYIHVRPMIIPMHIFSVSHSTTHCCAFYLLLIAWYAFLTGIHHYSCMLLSATVSDFRWRYEMSPSPATAGFSTLRVYENTRELELSLSI